LSSANAGSASSTPSSDGEVPPLRSALSPSLDLGRVALELLLDAPQEREDRVPVPLLGELTPGWRQEEPKWQSRVTEGREELEGLVSLEAVVEQLSQERATELLSLVDDLRQDRATHWITLDTLAK
jgi:hypothetical protein